MIIREIELFQGIDYEVISKIANICSEEFYPKGLVLFRNGDRAEFLYIMVEGTFYLEVKNGGTITYSLSEPGEVFGWSSMFEHGRYTASGVCATDLKVMKISRDKMNKIFSSHPEAGLRILRRLGNVFSKRLANAYNDLLMTRSTVTNPSIWKNDNVIPGLPEEPISEGQDTWHNYY